MKKNLKRVIVVLVSAAALALLVLLTLPFLLDIDAYRSEIEQGLSESLGGEVRLEELSLSPGWGIWVKTARLTVSYPPRTVFAEDVRFRLAIPPLLRGELQYVGLRFGNGGIAGRDGVLASGLGLESRFATTDEGERLEIESLVMSLGPGTIKGGGEILGIGEEITRTDLAAVGRIGATRVDGRLLATVTEETIEAMLEVTAPVVDLDEIATLTGWTDGNPGPELELTALNVEGRLENGILRFDPVIFDLAGGRHGALVEMNLEDPRLPYRLESLVEGVDLGRLEDGARGTGRFGLLLAGLAGHAHPEKTVQGTVAFELRDGLLPATGSLEQLADNLVKYGATHASKDGIAFDEISASFHVQDSRLRTRDLEVVAPDLGVNGRGTIGFDRSLRFEVTASLSPEVSRNVLADVPQLKFRLGDDGRVTAPMIVSGTLTEPAVTLDLRKLLSEGLENLLNRD